MTELIRFFTEVGETPLRFAAYCLAVVLISAALVFVCSWIKDKWERRQAKRLPSYLRAYDRNNNRIR